MEQPPKSLVLVHGAGSGPWVYSGWAASSPQLQVVAVDLQDGLDPGAATHEDYARAVVDACSTVPSPFVLCGWSMGGLVAMQAAARTDSAARRW